MAIIIAYILGALTVAVPAVAFLIWSAGISVETER